MPIAQKKNLKKFLQFQNHQRQKNVKNLENKNQKMMKMTMKRRVVMNRMTRMTTVAMNPKMKVTIERIPKRDVIKQNHVQHNEEKMLKRTRRWITFVQLWFAYLVTQIQGKLKFWINCEELMYKTVKLEVSRNKLVLLTYQLMPLERT